VESITQAIPPTQASFLWRGVKGPHLFRTCKTIFMPLIHLHWASLSLVHPDFRVLGGALVRGF